MSEVPSLWDELAAARDDRDTGADLALASDAISEWRSRAVPALRELAQRGVPFTVDAVIEMVGLPKGAVGTNVNNAIGALFLHASKSGLIRTTGRRVPTQRRSNHARRVAEWVGTLGPVGPVSGPTAPEWYDNVSTQTDGWRMARLLVSVLRSAPMDGSKHDIDEWWIEHVAPALDSYERAKK